MRKRSGKLNAARSMPPLRHTYLGREYQVAESEAVRWLLKQPDILQYIFDKVKNIDIVYDSETKTWQGVDYTGKDRFERPECYAANDDPYPLCKGADSPQGIAENDCHTCCLYEDYEGDGFGD